MKYAFVSVFRQIEEYFRKHVPKMLLTKYMLNITD